MHYSRRTILGLGLATLTGATGLGALVIAAYKSDRISEEYSDVKTATGIVVNKNFVRGGHLNPMDNINPTSDLKPMKRMTKRPDQYNVNIKFENDTATIDDKTLYETVNKDSQTLVEFVTVFTLRKTYDGQLLERKQSYQKIISVKPK